MAQPSLDSFVATNKPSLDSFAQSKTPQAPQQSLSDSLWSGLTNAGNIVNSIFPGKQVGQAIGTLSGLATEKLKGGLGLGDNSKFYDTSAPSPVQVAGDVAQGALTVAAPNVGNGASALGRIGANAALGVGLGATGAVAGGQGVGDVVKQGAIGGALGGGTSAVSEGVGKLVENLPNWFTQKALPKLENGNVDYALKNTKLGSIASNVEQSDKAVKSYGNQIESILTHPQYANETGDGSASIQGVMQAFPNAKLNPEKVAGIVADVVPGSEKLVDKVSEGTATLLEKNQLRQQLDMATKKVFTDSPSLTFNKQVAHSLANSLRNEVQSVAPETAPVFAEFSKEMNLNRALNTAQTKIEKGAAFGLYDILAAMGGSVAGAPGAIASVAAEKAIRSPAVGLGAAKGIQALGKTAPVLGAIGKAVKAPVIKALTSKLGQ